MNNSLKNSFKRVGAHVSSALKLYMSPQTSTPSVHGFVSRLVPYDLGIPLVRVGGNSDGGYLVPDVLDGIRYCFSPGVADTASFESDLHQRGIKSFLADFSVDGPPSGLPDCDFVKKFVGAANSDSTMTLDHWVAEKTSSEDSDDMILQMDIEGAEYETILATSTETLKRFRLIVLELHKLNHLDNRLYFRMVDAAMSKLGEHFDVAHLHPNNVGGLTRIAGLDVPRVAEITLLRKDFVVQKSPIATLPNPLDVQNAAAQKDVYLPEYWWKPGTLKNAA
ncbi:MAG: FkbM family methyltransferase [Fuerstiella sp.]